MKKRYRQIGFACKFLSNDDHIPVWTIHGTAGGVRDAVGRSWSANDPKGGWKAAKIEGAKIVKVEVRVVK